MADTLELLVWLDTISTVFAAYAPGPVCGANDVGRIYEVKGSEVSENEE